MGSLLSIRILIILSCILYNYFLNLISSMSMCVFLIFVTGLLLFNNVEIMSKLDLHNFFQYCLSGYLIISLLGCTWKVSLTSFLQIYSWISNSRFSWISFMTEIHRVHVLKTIIIYKSEILICFVYRKY